MKMASVDLMRASVDSGYMEEMYNSMQYDQLEEAAKDICLQLQSELFGENKTISSTDWQDEG